MRLGKDDIEIPQVLRVREETAPLLGGANAAPQRLPPATDKRNGGVMAEPPTLMQ